VKKPEMTAEYLRSIVQYDPATGLMLWRINKGGRRIAGREVGRIRAKDGYRHVKIDGRMYLVHRLAWLYVHGVWPQGLLDHENTRRADNWIDNLRECTRSQNGANRPAQANNDAKTKGVHRVVWSGGRVMWKAQIYVTVEGQRKRGEYLGCFETKQEASAAYSKRAVELFGEFARAA